MQTCDKQCNTEPMVFNSDDSDDPTTSKDEKQMHHLIEIKPCETTDSDSTKSTTVAVPPISSVRSWVEDETGTTSAESEPSRNMIKTSARGQRNEGAAIEEGDENNPAKIVEINPPRTLRRYESKIIMGFGIFERDVELAENAYNNNIDGVSPPPTDDDDNDNNRSTLNATPPNATDCPQHLLHTFGSDPDSVMRAMMRWKNEGHFPVPLSSSSESSNGSICRICHSGDSLEDLLNPCRCEGTVKWTHQTCLIKWLAEKGKINCELCGTRYRFKRVGTWNCFRVSTLCIFVIPYIT